METWSTRTLSSTRSSLKDVSPVSRMCRHDELCATRNSTMKYTVGNDTECTTSIYNELDEDGHDEVHGSSNADIGGVVSLLERPNHTTRMVRPRGVLEILHNCLITRVHTTTHFSRQHATAPRTSRRFGRSSSCLDESSHPWGPAGHPQYTGASHGGRLWMAQQHSQTQRVQTTTMDINSVSFPFQFSKS